MDNILHGIVEFLTERNKRKLLSEHSLFNIYFIMQYPDRPKLVYSPADSKLAKVPQHLLSPLIQGLWLQRKEKNEPGTDLIAVCCIATCINLPTDDQDRHDRIGHKVLVTTVQGKDFFNAYQTFFDYYSPQDIKFEKTSEVMGLKGNGIAYELFPKYL